MSTPSIFNSEKSSPSMPQTAVSQPAALPPPPVAPAVTLVATITQANQPSGRSSPQLQNRVNLQSSNQTALENRILLNLQQLGVTPDQAVSDEVCTWLATQLDWYREEINELKQYRGSQALAYLYDWATSRNNTDVLDKIPNYFIVNQQQELTSSINCLAALLSIIPEPNQPEPRQPPLGLCIHFLTPEKRQEYRQKYFTETIDGKHETVLTPDLKNYLLQGEPISRSVAPLRGTLLIIEMFNLAFDSKLFWLIQSFPTKHNESIRNEISERLEHSHKEWSFVQTYLTNQDSEMPASERVIPHS